MQALAEVDAAWTPLMEDPWPENQFDDQIEGHETQKSIEETDTNTRSRRQPFRRPRAGRACGSCHSRRIRCDAGSHGLPCTNCTAHSVKCFIPPKKKKTTERVSVGEMSRKHRGRYNPSKPWLDISPSVDPPPQAETPLPSHLEIEDNLRSLEDKTIFTGLYAAIAKQNDTMCFSRKDSIDMRAECIQNISQRISSEYRITDRREQDEWEPVLAFYEEDEEEGWMDKGSRPTPAPTGINVEEWSNIVGLR
ncbi:Transcriptional activator of fatty acid utilization [Cadophora gregata]|uniref:Transcriptional activator of fatty acid utilization n=1 Tax=Cadophora gregata TaxID=51156 RepID=UPI0026DD65EA|nr:Transcriptional activator of fatty acid utilization [Cadophora gregata]KAK0122477.1 Transcriptional activator of fatty acid utilization [Cadophora gregata]KAK0127954.1 Transcriptional activator of fatty acid utilization [Cadophora gregata f. sp. sojae]